jgi:hypothetical protein
MERRRLSESQERARKVLPQYGEGPLVKVAYALNQAEAELIAGLLLEEGVPSVIRRARGFDVPDFLAAGPRDILVAASGVDVARDVLAALPTGAGAGGAEVSFAGPSVRGVAMAMLVIAAVSVLVGLVVALLL